MLEEREVMVHRCGLLRAGESGPERIEGRDEVVARSLMGDEVVVVEHVCGGVPEIFVDGVAADFGAAVPFVGLCGAAEQRGEVGHVALVFVEEAVEADRSVFVGRAAEGAEAEAGVEA